MTPPPDPLSSPRELPVTSMRTLNRFVSLLGTFRLKEAPENGEIPLKTVFVPNNDALSKLVDENSFRASFPSLSLATAETHEHYHLVSESDKKDVEAHAISNLARSMPVNGAAALSRPNRPTESHVESQYLENVNMFNKPGDIRTVPNLLLEHLSDSLALLMEARLRAYVTLLARHGVSLEDSTLSEEEKDEAILAVEQKLSCLVDIGTRISIDNVVTHFAAVANQASSTSENGVEEIQMPLGMSAGFDISIPTLTTLGAERLAVSVKTSGTITGTFHKNSNLLSSVHVELDTHKLLSIMVQDAAKVISMALDHANEVSTMLHPHPPVSSCAEDLAFLQDDCSNKPLKKRKLKVPDAALKLLGPVLPVVSPDLNALLAPPSSRPLPPLQLLPEEEPSTIEQGESATATTEELSPETCANIVDFVIGEVDDGCFFPFHKKRRLNDAAMVSL